jgi:hypothetical protein
MLHVLSIGEKVSFPDEVYGKIRSLKIAGIRNRAGEMISTRIG